MSLLEKVNRTVVINSERWWCYENSFVSVPLGCLDCTYKGVWFCATDQPVHLLLSPHGKTSVSGLMQSLGRRYVQYVNRIYKRSGTLSPEGTSVGRGRDASRRAW